MPRFVVDLGDIEMSKEAQKALEADIQRTTLSHLTHIRFDKPFCCKFPFPWPGFILRRDFEDLLNVEKLIDKQLAQVPVGRI